MTGLRPLKTKRGDRMARVHRSRTRPPRSRPWSSRRRSAGSAASSWPTRCCSCAGSTSATRSRSRLVVSEITPLDVVRERAVREVEIRLAGKGLADATMRELAGVLDRHPGDRRVSVVVDVDGPADAACGCATATARRIRPERRVRPRRRGASAAPASVRARSRPGIAGPTSAMMVTMPECWTSKSRSPSC